MSKEMLAERFRQRAQECGLEAAKCHDRDDMALENWYAGKQEAYTIAADMVERSDLR